MALALATYQQLERGDPARALAKFQSGAQVQREIDYFKANIQRVGSLDDLMKNRRLMTFVLSGFGLDSEINALGRIKAVLKSDPADVNSLANKLTDRRFREMASELKTFSTGVATLKDAATVSALAEKYVANEYEKMLGRQDPALREARYFAKKIGSVTDVYQILGDKVLRAVTLKVLGLPPQVAVQPLESQAQLLRSRLNLKQFQNASAASASAAHASLKADLSTLALGATVGEIAAKAAREAASRLQAIKAGYDGLAAVQDTGGVNAAEIAVQENAIPDLVEQRGLAESALTALGHIADAFNRMSELRSLASDPANDPLLAEHKAEFAALAQDIHDAVDTTADYRFDGSTRNLLDGSLGDQTTTINVAGTTVTLNAHDLSGFLADVDSAAAAFAGVSGSGDAASLDATRDALALAGPQIGTARDLVIADRAAAEAAIAAVPVWAATLDTQELGLARDSIADADDRASQIAVKLAEIRAVAAESAGRAPLDDRSDLIAQFNTLRSDIDGLIATPGAGLDNLLDGVTEQYALTGGKQIDVRNRNLDSSIGNALSSASVSNIAAAQSLVDEINDTLMEQMTFARDRLAVDRAVVTQAATVFDPRGRLDEQLRTLATDLPGIQAKGNVSIAGRNLLADASGQVITLKTQPGASFSLSSHPEFATSVTAVAESAAAGLPGDPAGAYALLSQAATAASDIADAIDRDRRAIDPALLDIKRKLASTPAPDAASANKPTEATKRFVLRYLALADAESGAGGFVDPTLGLFGGGPPAGGVSSLDLSGLTRLRGGIVV